MTDAAGPHDNVTRLNVGGKEGRLTTSVGVQVPVRVFERGADVLILVLMLEADDELVPGSAEQLLLEYVSERGLVRFRGDAALDGKDLVRFTVADDAEVVQRREFVRVEAVQPVVLATGLGARSIDTSAIDVSGGGMLLSGPQTLELDSEVRFSIHIAADAPTIEGRGRIVRSDRDGRRGLVFEEISRADRQRLIHFVFERQRAALAKTGRVAKPAQLHKRHGNSR
jgi:hypothetical protein